MDYAKLNTRKVAVFSPRRTDDLRPEIIPYIGKTLVFQCAGRQAENDVFPGQYLWFALADGESSEGREYGKTHPALQWWLPDEDLDDSAAKP